MTTLPDYPEFLPIRQALRFVARRWWWVRLAVRLMTWAAATVLLVVASAVLSGYVNLSTPTRLAMLVVLVAGPAVGLAAGVVWPLLRGLNDQQAARQIELNIDGAENRFINAVQLAANGHLFDHELVRRTIDEIARDTSDAPVEQAVKTTRLKWAATAAGLAAGLLVLAMVLAGERFTHGLARLVAPESRGWVGQIRIDDVLPGNVPGERVTQPLRPGDRVTIDAQVSGPADLAELPAGRVWIRKEGDKDFTPVDLKVGRPIGHGLTRGNYFRELVVERSFAYYVEIGDTNLCDRPFRVIVEAAPEVSELRARGIYPDYLQAEQPADPSPDGNLDLPLGSAAQISARTSRPVVKASIASLDAAGAPRPAVPMGSTDGVNWSASLAPGAVAQTAQYRLVFADSAGQAQAYWPASAKPAGATEPTPAFLNITTRPDNPPVVTLLRPGAEIMVKPAGSFDVVIQASDDHGLSGLRLMTAKVTTAPADEPNAITLGPPLVRHEWSAADLRDPKGRAMRAVKKDFFIRLDPSLAKGDRFAVWIEAADNLDLTKLADELHLADGGGPQRAASTRCIVTVQDPAEISAKEKEILDRLNAELNALLKEQTGVRGETVALVAHNAPTSQPELIAGNFSPAAAAAVRKGQADFADHLLRLAKGKIIPFDTQTRPVQTSLMVLAYNDSADAKNLADGLTDIADAAAAMEPVKHVVAKQDRVIYALQSLLGLIGAIEKRTEQASTRPDDTNLPADIRDKWKKLADDLNKFIDQQRKDIAVTQTLAKKPVDDFTKEDLLKLDELIANQDKWEKFLDDKISDFSKLAEQDFSNPSLLKELVAVKTDVVMAKDALQKKATEIAVPLEESGLELAESLTTHIEKWLPDTPDREKWSMEDPVDQKAPPMAELPKELEDMVGDLMEQEEDLFKDIEDTSSKWADSIDKGAGWDAADGPISNMSAQGVTGNRLPTSSEISGRSGEGRTGKSSGEMVGNEAVGKGGRNTPTRLSGDPFQKGQVKDSSKEPPGGATGGGKVSGEAGEGLQGPVPPDLQKNLQRLASKQAAIRNKAEAVDVRFKANNFNNFALDKVISLMIQTEGDLTNNRYQNALRRKAVMVNNLEATKLMLKGDCLVQSDRSPDLPTLERKDVRNTDEDDLPPKYKELAKEYLKSLNEEPGPVEQK